MDAGKQRPARDRRRRAAADRHQLPAAPPPRPRGDARGGPPTPQTQAFWRYRVLADRIAAHQGPFTAESATQANACVNIQRVLEASAPGVGGSGIAATMSARTLWHTIYDQHALTAQTSFYLGETTAQDGTRAERRSPYLHFTLTPT